jgi:putative heme-binding domain-containing protein
MIDAGGCGACGERVVYGFQNASFIAGAAQPLRLDYLLENVIDPGASVGADFRAVTFTLADGRAVTGVISAADDRTLTVQTAQGQLVLDRRDVEEQTVQQQSLMPDGLLSKLSDGDVRDLVGYLVSPEQVPLPAAPR